MRSKIRDRDRGYKRVMRALTRKSRPVEVTIGIHEEDGGEPRDDGLTVAEVAAIHELGAPEQGIPRRSIIRDWADENESDHKQQLRRLAQAVAKGRVGSLEQALELFGARAKGEVQKRIADGIPPPLKQATVDRKGSSVPLIDTGQTRSAVDFQVKK